MRTSPLLLWVFACAGPTTPEPPAAALSVVAEGPGLPGAALLSVWAGADDDVWIVGADDGTGPVVLQWDGAVWDRVDVASPGDLWWVWSSGSDAVWMVGDAGRALELDRTTGTVVEHAAADASFKLFGIWGSADDDVYAVGGDVTGGSSGVIVRWDGAAWSTVATAPPADGFPTRQAFKVWGSAADDVWVVGTGSLVMHFDGKSWVDVAPPLDPAQPLTTVHGGSASDVYAVGGVGNATVLRLDGTDWVDDSPPPRAVVPALSGVFMGDVPVACGARGAMLRRTDGWVPITETPVTLLDLHACATDPSGAHLWAVGGDLVNLDEGVILYEGSAPPPAPN